MLCLISPPNPAKLLPMATFAWMNLVSFFVLDVFPTSKFTTASLPFLRYLETTLLAKLCYLDYLVLATYVREAISSKNTSDIYAPVIYAMLWAKKLEISELSRNLLLTVIDTVLKLAEIFHFPSSPLSSFQEAVSFLLVPRTRPTTVRFEKPQTQARPPTASERVESLMFDSFSVINDI